MKEWKELNQMKTKTRSLKNGTHQKVFKLKLNKMVHKLLSEMAKNMFSEKLIQIMFHKKTIQKISNKTLK